MLRQITYQGVFEPAGNGAFSVYFPDLPRIYQLWGHTERSPEKCLGCFDSPLRDRAGWGLGSGSLCHSRGRLRNYCGALGVPGHCISELGPGQAGQPAGEDERDHPRLGEGAGPGKGAELLETIGRSYT